MDANSHEWQRSPNQRKNNLEETKDTKLKRHNHSEHGEVEQATL